MSWSTCRSTRTAATGRVIVNSWLTDDDAAPHPADRPSRAVRAACSRPTGPSRSTRATSSELCAHRGGALRPRPRALPARDWDHFFCSFSSTDWLGHAPTGRFLLGDQDARAALLRLYRDSTPTSDGSSSTPPTPPRRPLRPRPERGECRLRVNPVLRDSGSRRSSSEPAGRQPFFVDRRKGRQLTIGVRASSGASDRPGRAAGRAAREARCAAPRRRGRGQAPRSTARVARLLADRRVVRGLRARGARRRRRARSARRSLGHPAARRHARRSTASGRPRSCTAATAGPASRRCSSRRRSACAPRLRCGAGDRASRRRGRRLPPARRHPDARRGPAGRPWRPRPRPRSTTSRRRCSGRWAPGVPADGDGRVLVEAFTPEFVADAAGAVEIDRAESARHERTRTSGGEVAAPPEGARLHLSHGSLAAEDRSRTLVIGLDGYVLERARPAARDGRAADLQALRERRGAAGCSRARCRSTPGRPGRRSRPRASPAAHGIWTSRCCARAR